MRMLGYMHTALQSLVKALEEQPQVSALSLAVLPEQERWQVLEGFNATQRSYPTQKLVHELFEEQVERTPGHVAVSYEDQSLTYEELNRRANQLARHLRGKGVGPDQLVGICVERSVEMVVGLLGILKAGGAYVPLDPDYPAERLQYMLEDSTPQVLLTQERLRERLPRNSSEVIALDSAWHEIAGQPTENPEREVVGLRDSHLAYVIYTSGSTGRPKGVMVEHRSVVNLWRALTPIYGTSDPSLRVGVNAPFTFDASVKQFIQLFSGSTLYIVPSELRLDSRQCLSFIRSNHIGGIDCTPSQLSSWVSAGLLELELQRPLTVLVGGESIEATLWGDLSRSATIQFYNVYGPTECTVDTTAARFSDTPEVPSIGRPLENVSVYLLDGRGNPVPVGVSGEMYVGGVGVARGYLNRAELTAQRFVEDPFSKTPQARMYKTGDLGRWRADGTIEYLGRNDQQVKIRGFRIELGEIESQLLRHEQVKEAVVVAREEAPGEKRLVAYVIAQGEAGGEGALTAEALRAHLKPVLPDYMVPSAFVMLESFPLTSSGKLDRHALPAPEQGAYVSRQYEGPQGEVEEILAGIWQTLLKVERVGRQDNFFELGGHSLLIVQMLERLRRVGLSAEVRRVFESPTLSDLAEVLSRETAVQFEVPANLIPAGSEQITPQMLPLVELESEHLERIVASVPGGAGNIQDIYPLAPLQEGILFHHLLDQQGGDTYARAMLLSCHPGRGCKGLSRPCRR